MKHTLLLWALVSLLSSSVWAQQKVPNRAQHLIRLEKADQVSVDQAEELLQEYFLPKVERLELQQQSLTREPRFRQEHRSYQLFLEDIPVAFSRYVVHSREGSVFSISGQKLDPNGIDLQPGLTAKNARERLLDELPDHTFRWEDTNAQQQGLAGSTIPEGELMILPPMPGVDVIPRLVYRFYLYAIEPFEVADYFVDAQTGEIVFVHNRLCEIDTPASGQAHYDGNVTFRADTYNSGYRLHNTVITSGGLETYRYVAGTNNQFYLQDFTSPATTFTAPIGVQAHYGGERTLAYFDQVYNRSSYDGNGTRVRLITDHPTYNNAFWDGTAAYFGNGDNTTYGPMSALDVVGHELTHGLIQSTADLVYSYESGALNESFADIFGEGVERHTRGQNDWLLGEEAKIGTGDAFRSFGNPNQFSMPDTYLGNHWWTSPFDNGGVHYNSSVQNHWFYLLVNGGSGTTDFGANYQVTGIGWDKAQQIAYRNLTVYLTSLSEYPDAREGAIQAARDLYGTGSAEEIAVTNAWHAVGVGNAYSVTSTVVCSDRTIEVILNLDDRPDLMAWNIRSTSTLSFIASYPLGSYNISQANSTISYTIHLPASGNYQFQIYALDRDGLCCGGSYEIRSQGNTLINGSQFDLSDAHIFCADVEAGHPGDTERPTIPQNVSVDQVTTQSARINWDLASDNYGVSTYLVFVDDQYQFAGSPTANFFEWNGLSAGTTYQAEVFAYDVVGNFSERGSIISFTTNTVADLTPPSAPTNITIQQETTDGFDLSWDAATDNVGVTEYEVFLDNVLHTQTPNTQISLSGLQPGTSYDVYVRALDAAGNVSVPSMTATGATLPGGPSCAMGNLTLQITFDQRPEDTGWEIKDITGAIYASGYAGSYAGQNPGSTIQETIPNLPDGDYLLLVYDAHGDGLCCTQGNGSFTLTDGSGTIASGNVFGYSSLHPFCVGSSNGHTFDLQAPTAPQNFTVTNPTLTTLDLSWQPATDNDAIWAYGVFLNGQYLGAVPATTTSFTMPGLQPGTTYSYFVVARDITGNFSAPSNTATGTTLTGTYSEVFHEGYFETGLDGWVDGGNDVQRYSGKWSSEGNFSMMLRDNSGVKSSITSQAFDWTAYDSVRVDFAYYARSMEAGEDFWLRFKDGSGWQTIATWAQGSEFNGNGFNTASVLLESTSLNFLANNKLRFQCDASGNGDKIFIDAIILTGYGSGITTSGLPTKGQMPISTVRDFLHLGEPMVRETTPQRPLQLTTRSGISSISIYPNPATDRVLLVGVHPEQVASFRLVDGLGRPIRQVEHDTEMNVQHIIPGLYYASLRLVSGEQITKPLVITQ